METRRERMASQILLQQCRDKAHARECGTSVAPWSGLQFPYGGRTKFVISKGSVRNCTRSSNSLNTQSISFVRLAVRTTVHVSSRLLCVACETAVSQNIPAVRAYFYRVPSVPRAGPATLAPTPWWYVYIATAVYTILLQMHMYLRNDGMKSR